jgi:hypothetical protein
MSKDSFYFSHDYNARSDDKIKKLIRVHGMVGYGVFWCIIEDLYNNANALHTDYEGIAYDLRVDENMVKSILNDFDLFSFENGSFGSTSIERRLDERNEKSEKARKSAFKRWNKVKDNANAMPTHCDSNAIKESKEDNSINVEFSVFWDLYDKKVGDRSKLIKKWQSLTDVDRQKIIEYIPKYKLSQPDKKYRKDPQTFFNNHSWNDEIITKVNGSEQLDKFGKPRPSHQYCLVRGEWTVL